VKHVVLGLLIVFFAADALSVRVEIGTGVGGAIVGGLAVYAKVSERLARIETRQDAIEGTAVRIEKKIDDNQARTERQVEDHHDENRKRLDRFAEQLTTIERQTNRREQPRP
jgi:hypothetical protein